MSAFREPQQGYSEAERGARTDLAACHRLASRFGFSEGIDNHLTMLVPGHADRFCLAPFGLLWSEVKASDFLELFFEGFQGMVRNENSVHRRLGESVVLGRMA